MGKRKLRSCANCGGRHGPPTGKNCTHLGKPERNEDEGATGGLKPEAAAMLGKSGQEADIAVEPDCGAVGPETDEDPLDFTFSTDEAQFSFGAACEEGLGRPRSPAGSGASGAMFLRQQIQAMNRERLEFEQRVDGRILHMENVLGKVAGVQQATLSRLVDMVKPPIEEKTGTETVSEAATETIDTQPSPVKPTASAGAQKTPEFFGFSLKDLSDTKVPDTEADWKDYHGFSAWHFENEKKKKNPFDHQAFIKKGEKITSFEDLMVVSLKTIIKLVDLKLDVKGMVNHCLFMADKASKNVFVNEAFVTYDEGVRMRAGEDGPSAFGKVLQEEVFTHFCLENTKK